MPTIAPGEGSGVAALVTSAPTADSEATAPVLSIPPTATLVIEGTYAVPHETPIVPVPAQMPLLDTDPDVLNFLLLGSDTAGGGVGHTDVIILLSVNRRAGTVAMWHVCAARSHRVYSQLYDGAYQSCLRAGGSRWLSRRRLWPYEGNDPLQFWD